MPQHQLREVAGPGPGSEFLDRAERADRQCQRVRPDVPQTALVVTPWRVERAVRAEGRPEPQPATALPPVLRGYACQPRAVHRVEPRGEEDHRRDGGLSHGCRELIGRGHRHRDRLLQQQLLAPAGRPQRQLGLHLRWNGERDCLDIVEQLLIARVAADPELGGDGSRLCRIASPQAGEVHRRLGAQPGRVRHPCPVPVAYQADPHMPPRTKLADSSRRTSMAHG